LTIKRLGICAILSVAMRSFAKPVLPRLLQICRPQLCCNSRLLRPRPHPRRRPSRRLLGLRISPVRQRRLRPLSLSLLSVSQLSVSQLRVSQLSRRRRDPLVHLPESRVGLRRRCVRTVEHRPLRVACPRRHHKFASPGGPLVLRPVRLRHLVVERGSRKAVRNPRRGIGQPVDRIRVKLAEVRDLIRPGRLVDRKRPLVGTVCIRGQRPGFRSSVIRRCAGAPRRVRI